MRAHVTVRVKCSIRVRDRVKIRLSFLVRVNVRVRVSSHLSTGTDPTVEELSPQGLSGVELF